VNNSKEHSKISKLRSKKFPTDVERIGSESIVQKTELKSDEKK